MPNGAELFVRSIKELGITHIFTLVGDHLNEVLAVAGREGIRIIDMRHESGVTHAADAWARITRKPALSLVTGGPGHTNSLTGIATANLAASPLIAVSGSRATTAGERGAGGLRAHACCKNERMVRASGSSRRGLTKIGYGSGLRPA